MKKILLGFLALCLLSLNAIGQKTIKTYHDPYAQKKVKEVYTVNSDGAKDGLYQLFESNGAKLIVANYKNGNFNGNVKEYMIMCDPGKEKLKLDENYLNGQKHGNCKKWGSEQGKHFLQYEAKFDNGKLLEETEYYSNGKKKSFATLIGICSEWYSNGNKKEEFSVDTYKKNGKYTSWHENGKIKETGNYENGYKNGLWTSYYDSGEKLSEHDISNQTYKRWSKDNKILFDGTFDGLKYSGKLTEYYSGDFKFVDCNIKQTSLGSLVTGPITKKVESIERILVEPKPSIVDGNLKIWFENGQLYAEYNFSNGKLNGEYTKYTENGKVYEKGVYQNGSAPNGIRTYDVNGNITLINSQHPNSFYREYCQQFKKYVESQYYSGNVLNKKGLYNKFLKVEEEYNSKILNETDLNKKISTYDELIKLYTRMIELRNTETTEIEANLKKAKTPEEIKVILGL